MITEFQFVSISISSDDVCLNRIENGKMILTLKENPHILAVGFETLATKVFHGFAIVTFTFSLLAVTPTQVINAFRQRTTKRLTTGLFK